jgi:hypothetical protein
MAAEEVEVPVSSEPELQDTGPPGGLAGPACLGRLTESTVEAARLFVGIVRT